MDVVSSLVARRRGAWLTLLVAVLAAVGVFLVPKPAAEPFRGAVAGLPDSYSSVRAEQLAAQLPSAAVQPAVVVLSRTDDGALTAADRAGIDAALPKLRELAVGGQVPPAQVSDDGTVALLAVPMTTDGGDERVIEQVKALRAALGTGLPDGVRAQVTGAPAFTTDLSAVFDGANVTLLLVTVIVVALLLLVTYRSPLLWIVPLVVVALTEQVALRLIENVLPRVDLSPDGATTGIASVLVFGAATDYALLLIARYREELRLRDDRFAAMRIALRRTSEAILASGGTVVLALIALLLAQIEGTRALGVACAIGIVMAVLSALFVLPAALVLCGRGVFWPFVPRVGSPAAEGRVWGRLGESVLRRPRTVAAAGVVVLGALALGATGLQVGLSQSELFRVKPEAVLGAQTLARAFPAGSTQPVDVLTTAPQTAARLAEAAKGVPGVASARVAEQTGSLAKVSVILTPEPGTEASDQAIRDLRTAVAAVPGNEASVGGGIVSSLDVLDAYERDTKVLLPIILALVGLVLVVLLRGVLAPVLLVVTVVLSFLASLGAGWLLFENVLGYPALDNSVVLLSFLFLVALGVDYNIFLVTRAREDAARLGTRAGMLNALRVTGGVITSAGILLAAVFAVLGVIPLITLAQIGIIVGLGVLLDTLLVRTVLVPALAFVLGDRFWWPGRPGASASAEEVAAAEAADDEAEVRA